MPKKKNTIDKDQYKHYLIDRVEILTNENDTLRKQLQDLQKEYNHLIRSMGTHTSAEHSSLF